MKKPVTRKLRRKVAVAALGMSCLFAVLASGGEASGVVPSSNVDGIWLLEPYSAPGVAMVSTVTLKSGVHGLSGVWTDWTSRESITRPMNDIQVRDGSVSLAVTYVGEGADGASDSLTHWSGKVIDADHWSMMWLADDGSPYEAHTFRRVSATELQAIEAETSKTFQGTESLPALRALPDNGLARTPVMGWSSWNNFRSSVDDKSIREMADALVSSGLRDAGYVYVNIDDGWQGARDASGRLHPNKKFPDMKALADYIHSKGLKFGIYSSPGPITCTYYVGSYGHETEDARTFAAWGVDYLKYDWCSALEIYKKKEQMQASFQKMAEALRATGRPIVYAVDDYGWLDVGKWGRKVGGNLWRTGGDSVFGGPWRNISAKFESSGDPDDQGPGGWNDPDMLLIGNGGLSADESRSHLSLWAMLAAPLIIGNDVRTMAAEDASILSNPDVIAINQDRLGKQGRRAQKIDSVEIWTKPLANGSTAVGIFNRGDAPATTDVRWTDIGLSDKERVRDLWARTDLGDLSGMYTTSLKPHESRMLRVRPVH